MKRYFFDLSGDRWEPDSIGTELRDDSDAQRQAIRYTGEVLKSEPHRMDGHELRLNVHDHDNAVRFAIVVTLQVQ